MYPIRTFVGHNIQVQIQRSRCLVLDFDLPLVVGDFVPLGQRAERAQRGPLRLRQGAVVDDQRLRSGYHHDHFRARRLKWARRCFRCLDVNLDFSVFRSHTLSTLRDSRWVKPRMLSPLMERIRSPRRNRPSFSAGELFRIL